MAINDPLIQLRDIRDFAAQVVQLNTPVGKFGYRPDIVAFNHHIICTNVLV